MTAPFPTTPEELTPNWLTEALRGRGAIGADASVTGVHIQPVAVQGTASLVVRLSLEYSPEGAGPSSLAAKLPPADAVLKAGVNLTGAPQREVRFYRQAMVERVPAAPVCFAAEYERDSGDFLLLLEDLSGWRTGEVLRPAMGDVESLLQAMGELHARYWNAPGLESAGWLAQSNTRWARSVSAILGESALRCAEAFPGAVGPHTAAVAELAVSDPRVFEVLGHGPQTVLHGDLHVQNAMFRDGRACVIDWSMCRRGLAMTDISRLFVSSLDVSDRRTLHARLIHTYLTRLEASGVEYSPVQANEDFAVGLIYNVLIYLASMPMVDLSVMRAQEEATGASLLDATFGRLEAALEDHDTLKAVRRRLADLPAAEA